MKTNIAFQLISVALCAIPSMSSLVLDLDLLTLARRSALLSITAYNRPPVDVVTIAPNASYYEDEPDTALLSKEGNKCIVAFRGTIPDVRDWIQNIDIRSASICVNGNPNRCCQARRGFRDGYSTPSYLPELEQHVSECMSDCGRGEGACELVLTGISQGGAIAAMAGVALADYDPFLVVFAQPPAIMEDCSHIIPRERYLRFVNSILLDGNDFRYDLVPHLRGSDEDQNGQMILIGDDPFNVKLYEQGHRPLLDATNFQSLTSREAHRMPAYVDRMDQLTIPEGSVGIGLDGFTYGYGCHQDNECKGGACYDNRCYDLFKGQTLDESFLDVAVRAAQLSHVLETDPQQRPGQGL